MGGGVVAGPLASGTDDVDVGEELDVERDLPGAVAVRTPQRPGVVGEIAGFQAAFLRVGGGGVRAPHLVEHAAVGGHGRTDVQADGSGVDNRDATDAGGIDARHVRGKLLPRSDCGEGRDEALEDHSRLTGTGHARDGGEPSFGQVDVEGMDRVDRGGGHPDVPVIEHRTGLGPVDGHARAPCP
ncbi:hypothetical protein [Rhodococcus sp. (in: high G+C Gram-positive bacteria)]|uniref:hypothetical protein n=1 Tax=Rhodococcus sp. TaxID=1831 RepID=UPI00388F765A